MSYSLKRNLAVWDKNGWIQSPGSKQKVFVLAQDRINI